MHVIVSSLFMQITLPFPVMYFVQSLSSEGFAGTEVFAVSWLLPCLTSTTMSSSRNAE